MPYPLAPIDRIQLTQLFAPVDFRKIAGGVAPLVGCQTRCAALALLAFAAHGAGALSLDAGRPA
jgi:uncharacterized membrane protein YphA (DoxX/SURF4 family)